MYKKLTDTGTHIFLKSAENLEGFLKLLKTGTKD